MKTAGHLATVYGLLRRTLLPVEPPVSKAWSTTVEDSAVGTIALSGRLSRPTKARDLVLLVHGLGGSSESGYLASAARRADAMGIASLRFNLRGADGRGADFYHGGLTADLHAVIAALRGSGFERIFVLGFSLGGHVTLRFATEVEDMSVAAVAAVCSPLDLAAGVDAIDRRSMALHRAYLLRRLKANYAVAASLGTVPTALQRVQGIRSLREWDSLTVVPRFGFDDADDYYSKASVAPVIGRLRRPALLLAAENDPMIPPAAIRPSLSVSPKGLLTVRWLAGGGHLGFSERLDLGLAGPLGLASQVLVWLRQAAAPPGASAS